MLRRMRWTASSASLCLLAACGGGGGGVSSTPVPPTPAPAPAPAPTPAPAPAPTPTPAPAPAPTPSPTPAPTPTPTPAGNPSLIDLTVSETFQTDGASAAAVYPGGATSATGRTPITVAYDAANRSYTVTGDRDTQTFRPQDIDAAAQNARSTVYRRTDGIVVDSLSLTKPGDSGSFNYRYVGSGIRRRIETAGGIEQNRIDAFTYGVRTADAEKPQTGNASYSVAILGQQDTDFGLLDFYGGGLVSFDFAAGSFSGEGKTHARRPNQSGYDSLMGGTFSTSGIIAAVTNGFTGQLTLSSITSYTASLDGKFYGPNAAEVGASFAGADAGRRQMAGNIIGRTGATSPVIETLRDLFGPISVQYHENEIRYTRNADGTYRDARQGGQIQAELLIDPAPQSYNFGHDVLSSTNTVAAETTARFTTYRVFDQGVTRTYRVYSPAMTNDELVLSYTGLALTDIVSWDTTRIDGAKVFGISSIPSSIPRTGSGVYQGILYGSAVAASDTADRYLLTGSSTLSFDFANYMFTGSMMPTATNERTGASTSLGSFAFANGTFGGAPAMSNTFRSDITGAPGTIGQLRGQFYGPDAQEVGGTFSLTTPGAGTTLVGAGAIVAKR